MRAPREGKLVSASGGTLLLDEIETISARAQVQLLRVLDDGMVVPLGSDRPRKVDIRLICASNADLSEEVRRGTSPCCRGHSLKWRPTSGPEACGS